MCSVDAFEAKHADISLLEAFDEMDDRRLVEIGRRKIEHYRFTNKEVRRTRKHCVDLFKPTHDGHDRGKNERDIGAAEKTNELTCRFAAGIHDARLAFCY